MNEGHSLLGLVGDVHAEHELLEIAIDSLRRSGATLLLCVGDIADGRGDVDRCADLLTENRVLCVRGNHDRWLLEDSARQLPHASKLEALRPTTVTFFRELPATREIITSAGRLLLCHGLGENDMAQLKPWDQGYALQVNDVLHELLRACHAFVVGGHTHEPMVRRFGATTVINPGTLHQEDRPGFALLNLGSSEISWFTFEEMVPTRSSVTALPLQSEPLGGV